MLIVFVALYLFVSDVVTLLDVAKIISLRTPNVLITLILEATSLEISPKLDFSGAGQQSTSGFHSSRDTKTITIRKLKENEVFKPSKEIEIINKVSISDGSKSTICVNNQCGTVDDKLVKTETSSDEFITDLKVNLDADEEIQINRETVDEDDNDEEVPVFKGLVGVKPEDITTTTTPIVNFVPVHKTIHRPYYPSFKPSGLNPGYYNYRSFKPNYEQYNGGYQPRHFASDGWTTERILNYVPTTETTYNYNSNGWTPCICEWTPTPWQQRRRDVHWHTTQRSFIDDKLKPPFSITNKDK